MMVVRFVIEVLKYAWALPNTIIGGTIGVLGLLSGGSVIRTGCVFEFHGGFVDWFFRRVMRGGIMAMTLGYSILGRTAASLDAARDHEMIHVQQYGRWGPFFLPAYVISSLVQRWKGNDPYRRNRFEVEAYAKAPINSPQATDQA